MVDPERNEVQVGSSSPRRGGLVERRSEEGPVPPAARNGAPEEIRTPDPQIRSLVLYPAELRARRSRTEPGLSSISLNDIKAEGVAKPLATVSSKPAIANGSRCGWQGVSRSEGTPTRQRSVVTRRGRSKNGVARLRPRDLDQGNTAFLSEIAGMKPAMTAEKFALAADHARMRSWRAAASATGRSGTAMRNVAPMVPSTSFRSPPWARTNSAAIASPKPVPPSRAEL